jgi:hypothetical protein
MMINLSERDKMKMEMKIESDDEHEDVIGMKGSMKMV